MLSKIETLKKFPMIKSGYKVGDVFNVYGMECRVGEDGHLVFPDELTFTEYKIDYPPKESDR